jgi:ubiquinone/menaquinone biosynthesis C-methylase UbiE
MSTTPTDDATLPPNHHAHHPGFAGFAGLLAAIRFTIGRGLDADLAVELTGAGDGDEVVDIGCGPGVAARRAVARGASSVLGVDPAAVMLRVARAVSTLSTVRRRGAAAVHYREGTAEALPLADGAVTVAWSLATVHHWQDVDAGLAEAHRVLGPGGRFLVIERRVTPGATGHASHGWTDEQAQEFAERCRAAGFTDISVDRHRPGHRRPVLSVLAHIP